MNESTESVCVRPPERRNCVPAQDSSCSNREAEVAAYLRWCATVQSARSNLQSPWRSGGSFLWCTNNRFRETTPERRSLESRRCRLRSPARRSSPSSCARGGSCVKIGPYPKFEPPRRSKQNAREKKTSTRFLWFKFWEKDVETSSGFTQMTGAAAEKSVWEGRTRAAHGWSTCQCFWNIFIYTVIITIKTNSFKKETNISKMRWIKIIQDIYIQHNKEDKKKIINGNHSTDSRFLLNPLLLPPLQCHSSPLAVLMIFSRLTLAASSNLVMASMHLFLYGKDDCYYNSRRLLVSLGDITFS